MRATPGVADEAGLPTLTEAARRAQIVHATIETIAELGFMRASYAQIAKRAGLSSTGLISYHFADKDELVAQVVTEVMEAGQAFSQPRIQAASTPRGRLRAYIESNLEFMRSHGAHIVAVTEIRTAVRGAHGAVDPYASFHERGLAQLEEYLGAGQRAGEFRRFSPRVMAITIRSAIDEIAYRLAADADGAPEFYIEELVTLFDRATQRKKRL